MRLFVLAKAGDGLRAVTVHWSTHGAENEAAKLQSEGLETTTVLGLDLQDVMQSHPAWFEIKGDS